MTTGLQPLKKDNRDYSYHKTFKTFGTALLPSEYLLISTILNQGDKEACTAYSASATKASEFGVEFDAEDFFNEEGVINGLVNTGGYDLRTPLKTGVKYGCKPLNGGDPSQYKDLGYYSVHASMGTDLYDAIKTAMWNEQRKKRAALAGLMWYSEWLVPQGIISDGAQSELGLHAVKLAGWKQINGTEYLIVQNSFGTNFGDGGLFYFTRSQVNKYFTEGCFIWSDNPNDPLSIRTISMLQDFLNSLANFVKSLNLWYNKQMPEIVPDQSIPPMTPPVQPTVQSSYDFSNPVSARHSVRVICDEEGLSLDLKNILTACVQVESGFNPKATHKNTNGTTDWGICQFNDGKNFAGLPYWIGQGALFKDTNEVLSNPEKCVRIMAREFKAGQMKLWASYTNGSYKKYL